MSFETPLWKERLQQWKSYSQEKSSCASGSEKFLEVDDSSPLTEVEWDQFEKYEFFAKYFGITLIRNKQGYDFLKIFSVNSFTLEIFGAISH